MDIGGAPATVSSGTASHGSATAGSWQLELDQTRGILTKAGSDRSELITAGKNLGSTFADVLFALGNATDVAAAVTQIKTDTEPSIEQAPKSCAAVVSATEQAMNTFENADQEMSETTTSLARDATGNESLQWLEPGAQVPGLTILRGFSGARR